MSALNQICFTDETNCVKFSGHKLKPNMCINCMKDIAKHNEKTVNEEDLMKVCNRNSRSRMFCKISVLTNSQENTCIEVSFLKETPTQKFSCEFCEIFKNTFLREHLRTTASVLSNFVIRLFYHSVAKTYK